VDNQLIIFPTGVNIEFVVFPLKNPQQGIYGKLGGGNCNQGINNPSFQDMDKQNLVLKKDTGLFQQPTKILQDGQEVYENKCFGSIDNPPKGKSFNRSKK